MTEQYKQSFPVELGKRLEAIAAQKNCDSVFELLSRYVQEEIAAGTIPRGIPGIEVNEAGDEVRITARDFTMALQRELATRFAKTLREKSTKSGIPNIGLMKDGPSVKRTGKSGVKIELPSGATLPLSDSVARELADQIEAAATA